MKFYGGIFLILIACLLLSSYEASAHTYTMIINSSGEKVDVSDNDYNTILRENITYNKGDMIVIAIDNPGKYKYVSEVVKKRTEYEVIPIYTGKISEKFVSLTQPGTITINLDRSGFNYQIKIIRFKTKDYEERKDGVTIVKFNCKTNIVYYFGAHVGIYIPLMRKNSYSVKPLPDQPPFSGSFGLITKNSIKEYNAIFIGTIYPFGFEPELLFLSNYSYNFKNYFNGLFKNIYKLFHIDLAFELSKNMFSRLYFGGGLSFGLCSFSFLACYEKVVDIGLHFGNNQVIPGILLIASPIRDRYRWSYGISITLPVDFAFSWIGNALH